MRRRLLDLAASLSLMLLVASAAMWVRSELTTEIWIRVSNTPGPREERGWAVDWVTDFVASRDGVLAVGRSRGTLRGLSSDPSTRDLQAPWLHRAGPYAVPPSTLPAYASRFSLAGVRAGWWRPKPPPVGSFTASDTQVEVRYWLVVLLAGVLPVVWVKCFVRERVRRRRLRSGLCTACGYDLRGSGEQCPECGAAKVAAV